MESVAEVAFYHRGRFSTIARREEGKNDMRGKRCSGRSLSPRVVYTHGKGQPPEHCSISCHLVVFARLIILSRTCVRLLTRVCASIIVLH